MSIQDDIDALAAIAVTWFDEHRLGMSEKITIYLHQLIFNTTDYGHISPDSKRRYAFLNFCLYFSYSEPNAKAPKQNIDPNFKASSRFRVGRCEVASAQPSLGTAFVGVENTQTSVVKETKALRDACRRVRVLSERHLRGICKDE